MWPYSTTCTWPFIGTTTSATSDPVWVRWVTDSTTNTTNTNATSMRIYRGWVRESAVNQWLCGSTLAATGAPDLNVVNVTMQTQRQRDEAHALVIARRRAEESVAQAAAADARGKADRRAKGLLVSFLSDAQRKTLEEHGYFDEHVAGHGTFRIHKGWAGNVQRLDVNGRARETFCIHPVERISDFDNMLAQRLMLRTEPEKFMRTANRRALA